MTSSRPLLNTNLKIVALAVLGHPLQVSVAVGKVVLTFWDLSVEQGHQLCHIVGVTAQPRLATRVQRTCTQN